MRITIVAVGKLKEKFWRMAIDEYVKRLRPYADVRITEVADCDPARFGGVSGALEAEAAGIVKAVGSDYPVLLAIDGKLLTSPEISSWLDTLAVDGISSISFVIGGSHGVAPSVEAMAREKLSFGKITLPHNLARVVLVEQLYRAFKISRGEPYHK